MRESIIYQEILQEGLQEGRQLGRQLGLQLGRQEEAVNLILRLLIRRFNALDESIRSQIVTLPLSKLEDLGEALLDFTQPSDLEAWLERYSL